jgi:hypothetical protein
MAAKPWASRWWPLGGAVVSLCLSGTGFVLAFIRHPTGKEWLGEPGAWWIAFVVLACLELLVGLLALSPSFRSVGQLAWFVWLLLGFWLVFSGIVAFWECYPSKLLPAWHPMGALISSQSGCIGAGLVLLVATGIFGAFADVPLRGSSSEHREARERSPDDGLVTEIRTRA